MCIVPGRRRRLIAMCQVIARAAKLAKPGERVRVCVYVRNEIAAPLFQFPQAPGGNPDELRHGKF